MIILGVPSFITLCCIGFVTACVWLRRRDLMAAAAAQSKRSRVASSDQPLLAVVEAGGKESKDTPFTLPPHLRSHPSGPLGSIPHSRAGGVMNTVVTFKNITYTVKGSMGPRPVLRGISGSVPSCLFALLGPSGAGKTTFLDILAGRKSSSGGSWSGTISIDGVEYSPEELRKSVGYIMQDDVLMGTMSVREYLMFQARLRLPSSVPIHEKIRRVEAVMKDLGLDHVATSTIGGEFLRGISGGEKRRVSIAAALITDDRVLIIDEPTSGLDSANAKSVVDTLVGLALSGRVIIMSIHQPRSYIWSRFDNVMLLGKMGELLYMGSREKCLDHFSAQGYEVPADYNPADFLLDFVAGLTEEESERLSKVCPSMPAPSMVCACVCCG